METSKIENIETGLKKNIRILFRTTGGGPPKKELGFGHVYRCLNLAKHFPKKQVYFLLEDFGGAYNLLQSHGFSKIELLEKNIETKDDIKRIDDYIKLKKIDVLIIDKKRFSIYFLNRLRKIVFTILITDLNRKEFPVNLVINGFIGFNNKIDFNKFGARCLLGPKYQIIDERFNTSSDFKKKYDLMATFGGNDEYHIINTFLDSLFKYLNNLKVKIILGPLTKKSKKILVFEQKFPDRLKVVQKTNNMQKEMIQARCGICAGGITTYEFASLKIPFAIICQVKDQLITAREWEKRNVAINLGLINKKSKRKIQNYIQKIVKNDKAIYYKNNFVDGKGSRRVVKEIFRMVNSKFQQEV